MYSVCVCVGGAGIISIVSVTRVRDWGVAVVGGELRLPLACVTLDRLPWSSVTCYLDLVTRCDKQTVGVGDKTVGMGGTVGMARGMAARWGQATHGGDRRRTR